MENTSHTFAVLAYKESPYLEECIQSLKKQTAKSHIILSTSTRSPFIENLSKEYEIPLIFNDSSEGIASDWSFAYNSSKTRYVTLAHQDDIYLPGYTEECLVLANKCKSNLITFTDYFELVNGTYKEISLNLLIKKAILNFFYLYRNTLYTSLAKKFVLAFGNPISCPTVMFNRDNIGFFEFSKQYFYNLDWDAWFRLSQVHGGFLYVKKKMVVHRIHMNSELVIGTESKNRQIEDAILFKKFWRSSLAQFLLKIYSFSYRGNLRGR